MRTNNSTRFIEKWWFSWLVVCLGPIAGYGGTFDFDDGTAQGWTLDQMYITDTQQYIAPFKGYDLINDNNQLSAYSSYLCVATDVLCDIYFESPDLLSNPQWQNIRGYSLDAMRAMQWLVCNNRPEWFIQLQLKVIDTADGNKEKLFAEHNGTDFVFHQLVYGQLYHFAWTPEWLSDSRYKVKNIRLRCTAYMGCNTYGCWECTLRGGWFIDNVISADKFISLPDALDAPSIPLDVDEREWFGERSVTFDGIDAIQSVSFGDNSVVQMRALVQGAGRGSFWWQVSSEERFDFLNFYMDGVLQQWISGEFSWSQINYYFGSAGDHELMWEYSKDGSISAGADAGWIDQLVWIPGSLSLGEAVDAPSLVWTTGGDAVCFGEASMTHDGSDAVQSGDINDGQISWMQTTVTGPGTVYFWWQTSCETGWDAFAFYIDDGLQDAITGEIPWTQRSFTIAAPGSHTLKWMYGKDGSVSAGNDAGWVDQFVWAPQMSVVTVTATDPTAGEPGTGQGSGLFTFTRTAPLTDALTVNFTVGGTAAAGVDYTSIGTTVSFAAGSSTATKTVSVLDDNVVEPAETVVATLAAGTGYTVGTPSSATVTIQDDDATVTVAATDATAGEPGTGQGSGTFTFTRSGFTATALTVNFAVGGTATSGSDYTSIGNSVSFAAGLATATKTVSVLDDSLMEPDETVGVTLASGTGYTVGSPASATVTIKDDDSSISEVIVDNGDAMGVEIVGTWTGSTSTPGYWRTNYLHDGNAGKGTKSVTFRPNLPSAGDYEVSVWYVTDANRATNVSMDIVYSGGTRTVLVNERVNGAQWVVLGTNTFVAGTSGYVKIRTDNTSSGYVIADAVRFKLAETPSTPVVTVAATDATAGEPGTTYGSGTFTFTRTAPLTAALTVNFTVGGTATAGSDYTSFGTTVDFAAGSATATKTVSVLDDSVVEGDETVVVTLASGSGYTVGSPSSSTVTIKDDDSSVSEVIVDNGDTASVELVGTWTGSTSTPGYWRTNYLHDGNTGKGTKSVTFRPTLPSAGNYEVAVWYVTDANRATNVPMDIVYSGGTRTVLVNERVNGGRWVVLGTNSFVAGTSGYVKIRTDNTSSGYVIADAVRFRPVGVTEVIVDNGDATGVEIVGTWTGSTSTPGYWRTNYLHDGNTGKGTKSVTFRPTLPSAGNYEVSVWYVTDANRATNVSMDIVYSGGTRTVLVNERVNGAQWVVLGTNTFVAGTSGYVKIRTDNTSSGYVIVDAVRFKSAGAP